MALAKLGPSGRHAAGVFALAIGVALAAAGNAETAPKTSDIACPPVATETGTVVEVADGDTLALADGRVLRLAGVEAPKAYLARSGADVEDVAEAARRALERLAPARGSPFVRSSRRSTATVGYLRRSRSTTLGCKKPSSARGLPGFGPSPMAIRA